MVIIIITIIFIMFISALSVFPASSTCSCIPFFSSYCSSYSSACFSFCCFCFVNVACIFIQYSLSLCLSPSALHSWILRPFPCLPMLTGMNCLFSVLYPISIADFMVAHVTDQIMGGVVNALPGKYNTKVGFTSSGAYKICASESAVEANRQGGGEMER